MFNCLYIVHIELDKGVIVKKAGLLRLLSVLFFISLFVFLSACGAKTSSLDAPTQVSIISGKGQVSIGWAPVAGATSYNVYYSIFPQAGIAGTQVAGAQDGGDITGLTKGTTYYFVVTAVGSNGESPPSAELSATPN